MSEHTTFEERTEVDVEDVMAEDVEAEVSFARGTEVPALTVKEAALILGKSMRALERSLSGKWGNKLPEGWTASKRMVDGQEEWQVIPPQGFRYEHILDALRSPQSGSEHGMQRIQPEDLMRSVQFDLTPSTEITPLLRELAQAHRELAEQRKLHMQDLRTLFELQGSMRLLEVNASETAKIRQELVGAQEDLITLRDNYKRMLSLPWWKRLFNKM